MQEYKCPFSAPLITHQFGCSLAQEVIHRGGTEINCQEQIAHAQCASLFRNLKLVALPAFGVEDDLLSMPHSVQLKIQYGGLLGLQRQQQAAPIKEARIEDIHALVVGAASRFGDEIPCEPFVADITAFKPRARRNK